MTRADPTDSDPHPSLSTQGPLQLSRATMDGLARANHAKSNPLGPHHLLLNCAIKTARSLKLSNFPYFSPDVDPRATCRPTELCDTDLKIDFMMSRLPCDRNDQCGKY